MEIERIVLIMPRGRISKPLRPDHIRRLLKVQNQHGWSRTELKLGIGGPFKFNTLQRAIAGKPIWEMYYAYIVQWLDRYAPENPIHDGKAAAAGDGGDNAEEEAGTTRTLRGSGE